jgi:hypothetical protein
MPIVGRQVHGRFVSFSDKCITSLMLSSFETVQFMVYHHLNLRFIVKVFKPLRS